MNKTSQLILNYIKEKKQVTARDLVNFLDIRERAVFWQLKKLYESGQIDKIGRPPKVYYFLKSTPKLEPKFNLSTKTGEVINRDYLIITPSGEKKAGVEGFIYWCQRQRLPIEKTAEEYIKTLKKYDKYKKHGFINGNYKLKTTFPKVFVDELFYMDFYSLERFGKTKLGWLLLYAKQSQDRKLIKELIETLKERVRLLITKYRINAVGFIPPTIKREVQLMKEVARELNFGLPVIKINKVKTPIIVAQKSLSKLEDRVENAKHTIMIDDNRQYQNILLIDDAVGSGASMNETGRKIKERGICKGKLFGLAITGSFKGFEVISEV